jgi:hypothetical protein
MSERDNPKYRFTSSRQTGMEPNRPEQRRGAGMELDFMKQPDDPHDLPLPYQERERYERILLERGVIVADLWLEGFQAGRMEGAVVAYNAGVEMARILRMFNISADEIRRLAGGEVSKDAMRVIQAVLQTLKTRVWTR